MMTSTKYLLLRQRMPDSGTSYTSKRIITSNTYMYLFYQSARSSLTNSTIRYHRIAADLQSNINNGLATLPTLNRPSILESISSTVLAQLSNARPSSNDVEVQLLTPLQRFARCVATIEAQRVAMRTQLLVRGHMHLSFITNVYLTGELLSLLLLHFTFYRRNCKSQSFLPK
jgi:hypothetical protein